MFRLFLLFCALLGPISAAPDTTLIKNKYSFMADKGLISDFANQCIKDTYKQSARHSYSIETLINLIERLEDNIQNTTDSNLSKFKNPKEIGRILLQRFHLDDIDFNIMIQEPLVQQIGLIDTKIAPVQNLPVQYYFPDYIYTDDELCTLLFMFSHVFLNNTQEELTPRRFRRATYNFQGSNQKEPINTLSNVYKEYPIREKGVVSFRQNIDEAISPSKVLIGIVAGLTQNFVLSVKDIISSLGFENVPTDLVFKDPILAVTLGELAATNIFYDKLINQDYDEKLIFGLSGQWSNNTCCRYYGITDRNLKLNALRNLNRGTLAQIRGALDGYIIGKNLNELKLNNNNNNLKLSTILKSYYSPPRASNLGNNNLGVSYCDRSTHKPKTEDLNDAINSYSFIYRLLTDSDSEHYSLKSNLFFPQMDQASNTKGDICSTKPSGNLNKNSPCETPSDLIFVIDPKLEFADKSATLVSEIVSKTNKIGKNSGSITVFSSSNSGRSIELPHGPGSWPFSAYVFNMTDIGSVGCQIINDNPSSPSTNLGKYLHNLNQTLFNYKWWTPNRYGKMIPSKNVIIVDYDTLQMPTTGTDMDLYDEYKNSLVYRNRDVQFFVVSNKKDLFVDLFLNDKDQNIVNPGQLGGIGNLFSKKICENPAALIYNECYEKPSQNLVYENYATPGYKQNWAMYPEYFLKSFDIEIKVKAHDGSIKYCYDRYFPPEKPEYCKDLEANGEDIIKISNPCYKESVHSCKPFYFTIWGKSTSKICTDARCQSLDQVKYSITTTGISCNSSLNLKSWTLLNIVCFFIIFIRYFNVI